MSKIEDKVSVIVPIYNAGKYLEECINSIVKQTYDNLQIILVNDGSRDNSWKICQQLQKSDNRISITSQPNSGVSVARNTGLDLANGKWIMFVDPDDILDKNIVSDLLDEVNSDRDIIISTCYGFDTYSKKRAHFFTEDREFKKDKEDLYLQLLDLPYGQTGEIFTAIGVPWGKLYRRSFLDKFGLKFDSKLRRMQDNIFNMYAFYYAREIKYVDKPLYYYRLENINTFWKRNILNYEKIFKPVIKARYRELNDLKLYSNSEIFQAYINESAITFINILNSKILNGENVRVQDINKLKSEDVFKDIFSNDRIAFIKDKKNKIKVRLINFGIYPTIYKLIYKVKNVR